MLFERQGVDEVVARDAFELAAAKLPVKTTVIKRTIM
jgi:large subunit ribosomal protein L16